MYQCLFLFIMKRIITSMTLLAMTLTAIAKPVSPRLASEVADFFFQNASLRMTEMQNMYLFTPESGRGYVLVSADDCVRPVLAYSPSGAFDPNAMPEHVRQWIDGYVREIDAIIASGIAPSVAVEAEWNYYLGDAPKALGDTVAPMLTTQWNQAPYYNLLCPYDTYDSMYTYSGCTATATAQIMKYWNHPAVGWGSYGYYHDLYGLQYAIFDTTHYRWNLMPDVVNSLSDSAEIMAVAELMYHVGVAVRMNYGTRGSGAAVNSYGIANYPSAETALKTYFKYSPMLSGVFKSDYDDYGWDSIMGAEIDAGRPVLYAGHDSSGGHAFVLDGYSTFDVYADSTDTVGVPTRFFHVNWGWGGAYDGYYTITNLAPGSGGIGGNATYTFNMNNSAVIGIQPSVPSSDSVAVVAMVSNNESYGIVTGSGTFVPMQDTAFIWARAVVGYRFVRWQSGSTQNPIQFLVSGDIADTAIFEPITGDTVGYCFDGNMSSWHDDYGNLTEWGIRLPRAVRGAGRQMTAVQFYAYSEGTHTVKIYIGDAIATASLLYTGQVQVQSADLQRWITHELDTPLNIPEYSTIWVTMSHNGGGYPAATSRYCGNSDGSWYHLPTGWVKFDEEGIYYATWMLRAVFQPRHFTIEVRANDINACTVFGGGEYMGGDQVTIGAIIFDPDCHFVRWTDGSPYNPYTFTATADTLMIAYCDCDLGIDDIDPDGLTVSVVGRTIDVETALPVAIYDIQGRLLTRTRRLVAPAAGVYVVRAGEATRKVVVY